MDILNASRRAGTGRALAQPSQLGAQGRGTIRWMERPGCCTGEMSPAHDMAAETICPRMWCPVSIRHPPVPIRTPAGAAVQGPDSPSCPLSLGQGPSGPGQLLSQGNRSVQVPGTVSTPVAGIPRKGVLVVRGGSGKDRWTHNRAVSRHPQAVQKAPMPSSPLQASTKSCGRSPGICPISRGCPSPATPQHTLFSPGCPALPPPRH